MYLQSVHTDNDLHILLSAYTAVHAFSMKVNQWLVSRTFSFSLWKTPLSLCVQEFRMCVAVMALPHSFTRVPADELLSLPRRSETHHVGREADTDGPKQHPAWSLSGELFAATRNPSSDEHILDL